MTEEQFEKEVEELSEMLRILRTIRDKSRTRWLEREIREQFIRLLKGN